MSLAHTKKKIASVFPVLGAALLLGSCAPLPIKIGVPLVLTGVNSKIGVAGRDGIELTARSINEAGGIGGRPIEIIVRDDGDDPDRALATDQELAKLGVVALVGHMTSMSGLKAIPWINQRRLLLVSPTISSTDWTGKDDWFLRTIASNEFQGAALAREALRRGYRKAVVFVESGNKAFTAAVAEAFSAIFAAGKGVSLPTLYFASSKDLDHLALARQTLDEKPDLVLFAASAYDSALFCQALAKIGAKIPVFASMWSMTSDLFLQGGRSVEGMVVAGTVDLASNVDSYRKFRESYMVKYGEEPSFGSVHGYEAMMLLATAAKDVAAKGHDIDSAELRAAILARGSFAGLQTEIIFDQYGDCTRPYALFEATGGSFKAIARE
jgi:branched-chain amino acid transport system substrate-binding protein